MIATNHPDKIGVDFYSAILHSIKDPLNILDRNLRIVWANEARAKFHRQNLDDMIGRFCYEMFQRRTEPCLECPVRVLFDSGKPCFMEKSVVLPDGSRKWGDVRAYPVFDGRGEVAYAVQIMLDSTKRKADSQAQKRYVESLETTVNKITEKNVESLLKYPYQEPAVSLTEREIEILGLISNGFSNVEVGRVLAISPHTVKSHVINIFEKLGVKDRTQAAVWAAKHKLV
jgi:PAS domain S-box-containing protein